MSISICGATYFLYPGETLAGETKGIDYWERCPRRTKRIDRIDPRRRAVSPIRRTSPILAPGAGTRRLVLDTTSRAACCRQNWGVVHRRAPDIPGSAISRWTSAAFRCPLISIGGPELTFTRKVFNLDLRYHDTNLTKENCFVFTGDPNARPGGSIDPVTKS